MRWFFIYKPNEFWHHEVRQLQIVKTAIKVFQTWNKSLRHWVTAILKILICFQLRSKNY